MSHFYEDDNPTLCLIYFDIIEPAVCIISLIMMVPAMYKYSKAYNMKYKCLFWSGLIFFITIFVAIILVIFYSIYFCRNFERFTISLHILSLLYIVQTMLLLGIVFARLYIVFVGSIFALSTIIIRLYLILYIICMSLSLIAAITFSNWADRTTTLIISGLAYLLFIILMIMVVSLFISKMVQVYRNVDNDNANPKLITIITKTCILALGSLFITLLNASATVIGRSSTSVHILLFSNLFTVFDLVSNFWCIILTYGVFHDWYLKVCRCCDAKCTKCWHKIVRTERNKLQLGEAIKLDQMEMVKDVSSQVTE